MDEKTAAKLRAQFPPEQIGKLPRGGIQLDYVGHADVTSRLLEADPEWNWEPAATDEHGLPLPDTDERGNPVGLWIRLTVAGVTRLGYGSCPSNQHDAIKVLIGDALRNAAMRFGVALDLWAKGDRADPTAENPSGSAGQASRRGGNGRKQQGNGEDWRNSAPVNKPRNGNGNGHVARPAQAQQPPGPAGGDTDGDSPDPDAQVYADNAAEARSLDALRAIHKEAFDAGKLGATIRNPASGNTGPLGPYLEWRRKQLTDDARAWKELEQAAGQMSTAELNAHVKKVTGTEIEAATAAQLREAAKAVPA